MVAGLGAKCCDGRYAGRWGGMPDRARLSPRERALVLCVVLVHVLLIVSPLDVLAPMNAHHVGAAVWHGRVPYRDFGFEYPPLALVAFLLPGLVPAALAKSVLALQATALECAVGWFVLRRHPDAWRRYLVLSLLLFPFLSGGFDAVPMAAIAFSTALLADGRASGWWVAAAGALAKVSPATIWVWARTRPRAAIAAAVVTGAGLLAPLAIAPNADRTFIGWSLHRGVEAESVAGTLAWLAHLVTGASTQLVYRYRSTEIVGAAGIAAVVSLLALVGLALVARHARRIDPWDAAFVALLLFLCGFKVLSPQYLAWGAPLAAIVGGRRFQLYAVAAALTTATYAVASNRASLLAMTAGRNAVLVALTVTTVLLVCGRDTTRRAGERGRVVRPLSGPLPQ
jgi:glycosyl transferase family 87